MYRLSPVPLNRQDFTPELNWIRQIKWQLKFVLQHRKKVICSLIVSLLLITNLLSTIPLLMGIIYNYTNPDLSIACFSNRTLSLPDISDINPIKERSIFFLETTCNSFINGKITITARQACAVESAAKMNPNMDVYLLYASPGMLKNQKSESDRILDAIGRYQNVKIHHVDIPRYLKDTPVENLWWEKKLLRSWYAPWHMSDVLRYVTLWKYGGIYLDLDVIVIKSLEEFPLNYAGLESEDSVAEGVLSFDYTGKGHKYAQMCMNDLKDNFALSDWGYNGPGLITRLLRYLCGVYDVTKMVNRDCEGFTVYSPETFYAVPFRNWTFYFKESFSEKVFQASKKSYVVHVWNKVSSTVKLPLNSKASYLQYARTYCPRVVQQCDNYF